MSVDVHDLLLPGYRNVMSRFEDIRPEGLDWQAVERDAYAWYRGWTAAHAEDFKPIWRQAITEYLEERTGLTIGATADGETK